MCFPRFVRYFVWSPLLIMFLSASDWSLLARSRAAAPTLTLGPIGGYPGNTIPFGVSLQTDGASIGGAQTDITFDRVNTPIAQTVTGDPDCTVDPAIGKEGYFAFLPIGCSASDCSQIRALVVSTSNTTPIADGASLFTCNVKIPSGAAPGIYPLVTTGTVAGDGSAQPVPLTGVNNWVTVYNSAGGGGGGGGGFSIGPRGSIPVFLPLVPLILLAARPGAGRKRKSRWSSSALRRYVLLLTLIPAAAEAAQATHPTEGYTVTYPDSWFVRSVPNAPLVLANVPSGNYFHGGILPEGGADITIQVLPPDTDEYAKLDQLAFGSQNVHRTSRLAPPPARLDQTFEVGPDVVYKQVCIAVRSGGKLFLLILDYRTSDPKGPEYEQVLSTAVSSLKPAQ